MTETIFRDQLARDGFTEVLVRDWAAGQQLAEHSHPFDARLLVLAGDMQLTRTAGPERFTAGESCEVPRGQPHAEQYGPQGAQLLVGRRYS